MVDLNVTLDISNATTLSKCGWSAFDGMRVTGKPVMTFVNGQMVWREGEFIVFDGCVGAEVSFV